MATSSEADVAAEADRAPARRPGVPRALPPQPRRGVPRGGLEELAQEMQLGAGKAMTTLDMRESKSSLAGVMMAAAMEGVGIIQFAEHVAPHLDDIPEAIGDVLSRVRPTSRRRRAGAAARRPPRRPAAARRRTRSRTRSGGGGRRRGTAAGPRRARRPAAAPGGDAEAPRPPRGKARGRRRREAQDRRRGRGGEDRQGGVARGQAAEGRGRRSPTSPRTRRTSRARPTCPTARTRRAPVSGPDGKALTPEQRPLPPRRCRARLRAARRRPRRPRRPAPRAPPAAVGRPRGPPPPRALR